MMLRMSHFAYQLEHTDPTGARAGIWRTPHGEVKTPAFMPVGTLASVKGITPDQLRDARVQMVLANTYHLALRPGADVVADMGGLHQFMQWDGPILTDSGGFQVFSLAQLSDLNDERVVFRSHIDGSPFELTPEKAVHIQEQLGADCIMCLDECPPIEWQPKSEAEQTERLENAVRRTTAWARRCRDAQRRDDQALFGIVQGGIDARLRERSARELLDLDFPGYAVGGLSVGEDPVDMYRTLDFTTPHLPTDRPRYLMGVGRPIDLIEGVLRGIDLFDCVMPTRNGRNATAFTSVGRVRMRNLSHQRDDTPLDPNCECLTCRTFSRAYLRHLFIAGEMLGPILLSLHNIAYYQTLLRDLRTAIQSGTAAEFRSRYLAAPNESV